MEKLPMCRICLADNVPMYVVVNKNLHELYKKLTDIPFVTEDSRPILACSICCTKLKQCYRLMMKCCKAEELFAQMTIEDYELNPLINQDHLEFFRGLVKTPIECINILDVGQTECIVVKEELPAACERQDDIIEPKEEYQSDDIKQKNQDIGYSDQEDISFPSIYFEKDSEDDEPIMEFKTEVEEEQETPKQKQRAVESNRSTVAKKQKLDTRRTILEDTIEAKQEQNEQKKISHSRGLHNTHIRTSKPVTTYIEPFTDTKPRIYSFENNTAIDTHLHSNRTRADLSSELRKENHFSDVKENLFKCDFCQRRFSHKGHLTRHLRGHTVEKPNKCDLCQRSFSQGSNLKRHVRIHTGDKPYKCDLCQRCFSCMGHLTRHLRGHNGEKPYKCDICQRSFSQGSNLKRHVRIHTGDKPYKCDLCQRCFIDKRDITKHINLHKREKPFNCEICQFSSNDKRDLTKHIRKHTGENSFDCGICQRSFRYASDLKKHIRIHTGEKPYQCDICQRSFNVKGNLRKHMVRHSGGKPVLNVI